MPTFGLGLEIDMCRVHFLFGFRKGHQWIVPIFDMVLEREREMGYLQF